MPVTKYSQTPIFKPTLLDNNLPISILRGDNLKGVTPEKILSPSAVITKDEENLAIENPHEELIQYHYYFGQFCSIKSNSSLLWAYYRDAYSLLEHPSM